MTSDPHDLYNPCRSPADRGQRVDNHHASNGSTASSQDHTVAHLGGGDLIPFGGGNPIPYGGGNPNPYGGYQMLASFLKVGEKLLLPQDAPLAPRLESDCSSPLAHNLHKILDPELILLRRGENYDCASLHIGTYDSCIHIHLWLGNTLPNVPTKSNCGIIRKLLSIPDAHKRVDREIAYIHGDHESPFFPLQNNNGIDPPFPLVGGDGWTSSWRTSSTAAMPLNISMLFFRAIRTIS